VFRKYLFAVTTLVLALTAAVRAQSTPPRYEDPDWPCQQQLVPKLAAASYWSEPLADSLGDWHADAEIADLVRRLSPRSVSTGEGLSQISVFERTLTGDRQRRLVLAFRGLLEETDRERTALIEKLKNIGRRQRELADLVGLLAADLRSIPPDATGEAAANRLDLQQRHDFTARNFDEIQRTVRYACETPVELDARLGAWARALQRAAAP
jgi:hypothetical protein